MKDFRQTPKCLFAHTPLPIKPTAYKAHQQNSYYILKIFLLQLQYFKMAREKRSPHKSPSSLAEGNRDIAQHHAKLVQDKNTLARRQALANSSLPEETPIPVSFVS
jgi:hypothetical protein